MNQVLQAPSVQGDGITSDARSHYREKKMRFSFFPPPGRCKRGSPNQGEAPRRILSRAAATPWPASPSGFIPPHGELRCIAAVRLASSAQKPVSPAASATASAPRIAVRVIHRYLPAPRQAWPAEKPPRPPATVVSLGEAQPCRPQSIVGGGGGPRRPQRVGEWGEEGARAVSAAKPSFA